ncbi:hypothetical protein [Paraburkholderia youngii]|uniref:hypothetical protein n=1 Tax=Paraburkholderia youngii TaxID=2782701 RepID=UPI003D1AF3CA
MRTPIQIAALPFTKSSVKGSSVESTATQLVALCDDGTIWTMFGTQGEWVAVPKIPQGPTLEDWLLDVGAKLASNHLYRSGAVAGVVEDHRSLLVTRYNDGMTATDAARLVAEILK